LSILPLYLLPTTSPQKKQILRSAAEH
jgi:hypothetical protein